MLSFSSQLGNTALHIAAGAGYQAVVKLLMEYGASPLIENKVRHQKNVYDYSCQANSNFVTLR